MNVFSEHIRASFSAIHDVKALLNVDEVITGVLGKYKF